MLYLCRGIALIESYSDHVPRETPAAIVLGPRKASAPDDELGGENDDDDGDDDGNGNGDEETSTAAVKSNEQSEDKNLSKTPLLF